MQETHAHAQNLVKKSQALANALHQQGRTAVAVARLGSSIALLTSLCISASESLEPLVQSLVTLRAGLYGNGARKASVKTGSRSVMIHEGCV